MIEIFKIPNQVIKESLQPLDFKKIDSIALHHMACDNSIKEIESMHINKGYRAIGYNFWVGFDGKVYEGRGFNLGAGVENQNGHIISIGFQGDYHTKERIMPNNQFNSGIDIIKFCLEKIPTIKKIGGHKDFMPTACPGNYFPLEEFKNLSKRDINSEREEDEMIYNYIDNNMPEWAKPTIQKLVDKGYLKGDETGKLGLNDTMLKTFVVMERAGLFD